MMYDAVLVSKLIIDYCIDIGKPIDNLKLIKLLFFMQLHYWEKRELRLFNNTFIKTKYGGQLEDVYYEYNKFSTSNLPKQDTKDFSEKSMNDDDWKFIVQMVNQYIDENIFYLVFWSNVILKEVADDQIIIWNKLI